MECNQRLRQILTLKNIIFQLKLIYFSPDQVQGGDGARHEGLALGLEGQRPPQPPRHHSRRCRHRYRRGDHRLHRAQVPRHQHDEERPLRGHGRPRQVDEELLLAVLLLHQVRVQGLLGTLVGTKETGRPPAANDDKVNENGEEKSSPMSCGL